ncbi:hypothetical protein [Vibrio paracholerae]|uniref:hypothetical protein n=1 Tax=Vibrio paracholerae TaxID=650003 RepID=UPI001114A4CF|nr:hypothetical protein [Vibrio paracholerae]WOQ99275.1 hypothetical protein R4537_01840 [Vibrio paracholerae]
MSELDEYTLAHVWGHMGTHDSDELKKEIKELLGVLEWSQRQLARELYMDEFDDDDAVELRKYEERVRKALSRSKNQTELLYGYLCFIKNHYAFRKTRLISNAYQKPDVLSREQFEMMKAVSKLIDEKLG